MDLTAVLAGIWGPTLLAIGVGMFMSRGYYSKMYRDLEKDALAMLAIGIACMVVGIVQVQMHARWESVPQIVVTLLGWATLLKGVVLLVAPVIADKRGDMFARYNLVPAVGALMIALGGYLSWLAYVA